MHATFNNLTNHLVEDVDSLGQFFVVFTNDGTVSYVNKKAMDLFGKSATHLLGSKIATLFPGLEKEIVLPVKSTLVLALSNFFDGKQVAFLIPTKIGNVILLLIDNRLLYTTDKDSHHDWTAKYQFSDIIGVSTPLLKAKARARRVAPTDATVLITGESGTGKELFAHAVHAESKRRSHPFVRVNCSSIPSELLEAEMFGYEAGAFTGARKTGRRGMFEIANTGTIFLDEISQMNWDIQAKLLRVLQEKEIVRIGGSKPIMVDFRLILATNASLEELVHSGKFRSDLYYRINVFPIFSPPLRERKEDISILIEHFLKRLQRDPSLESKHLSSEVLKALHNFNWPGNVRELLHVLEQLLISSTAKVIGLEDLPLYLQNDEKSEGHSIDADIDGNLRQLMDKAEKEILVNVLKKVGGNRAKAAKILGIHRSGLYQKLGKHGL